MAARNHNDGNGKVAIDKSMIGVIIQVFTLVFVAGIGWSKLSYAEDTVKELRQKVEHMETTRYDIGTKLATIDQRVAELTRNLDRIATQLENSTKKPVMHHQQ